MPDDFVIARNPGPDSTLPFVLRIPYGDQGILLKARETWPRTAKVYCHRFEEWPDDAEILERVRRCGRAYDAARRSTSSSTAAGRTARSS